MQAEVVFYSGYDALMEALGSGQVDAIAAPDLSASYDCLAIVSIGASDYYFAVSKARPDILSELNMALYEIQTAETDYNSRLFSRYYYKTASGLSFNSEELSWLAEHDNTLRLGYFAENLPFSGEEDGQLTGILATVMEALEREYGLTVQTRPYTSLTEQDGLVLTDSIVDTTPVILYRGEDYDSSLSVIAAADECMFGPAIVSVLFPEAEIYRCGSQEECLKAVAEGKAGSTLIPSSRINILNADPLMKELSFAEVAKRMEVGLLASREDRRAASIVNKGIEQSSELLSGVVLAQHSAGKESVSLADFVRSHVWPIITLAALVILVLGLLRRLYVSQKQVVAALEEARNANTANTAKTTFLNNMSHDIRTPMNAIMGFTGIALKHQPTPEIRSCLEKIRQSSEYLLALINDVLDISRIESGSVRYTPAPVDITELTDSVLNIAKGCFVGRNLELQVKRAEVKTPYVMTDEVRLREVLMNILSNAVKFTNDGGVITVETECRPGKDERHITACYRISDTGIGMDESFQKKVFDEFSQEETGARTNYRGTGLGMTITKRYVDLMGGTIRVESKKGVGTTVTVELPMELTERSAVCRPARPAEHRSLKGVRVLLAEDNGLNAEIAQLLLEEQGMKVTRAVDGQEAVTQFAEHPAGTFDLILMDIMMPHLDGYGAAKAIRSMADRPDGRSIPIIAMTASAFSEDMQAAAEAGMNAHLSKPIVMEQVLRVIGENLGPGLLDNNLPYSDQAEDGSVRGILSVLSDTIEQELGITVEERYYSSSAELLDAMEQGEVDAIGPVYGDLYLAEQYGQVLTNELITTTPVVLYAEGDFDNHGSVIAVCNETLITEGVIHVLFPDAEIYACDSMEECLNAVVSGKADSTVVSSVRLNTLRQYPAMQKLQFADLPAEVEVVLAATRENRMAASVLNKGIALSSASLNGSVLAQSSYVAPRVTVKDFVQQHMALVLVVSGVVIVSLGVMAVMLYQKSRRLRAALEQAKEASMAKTVFLSNMSHDIRTPMNAIMGLTHLAQNEEDLPTIREYLGKIDSSSDFLLGLINDILDMSKIESGDLTLNPEPLTREEFTDSIDTVIRPLMESRRLHFECSLSDGPECILADRLRFKQMFLNLLSNAAKFTPEGGQVALRLEQVPAEESMAGMRFTVQDTGIGMSAEFLEHLYDPFSQEHSQLSGYTKGTGLGLPIVKSLVDAMGGTLTVQSTLGKSTVFTVELRLPLAEPASLHETEQSQPGRGLREANILLVEDNEINTYVAKLILEEVGCVVTTAENGQEALDRFSSNPPATFDAILMDVRMPIMDGIEATKAIRALDRPDAAAIPIIAMTADAFAEEQKCTLESGMNEHLSKPIDPSLLYSVLEEYIHLKE